MGRLNAKKCQTETSTLLTADNCNTLDDERVREEILSKFNFQGPLEKEISALKVRIDAIKADKEETLAKIESYKTLESDGQLEDDLELANYKCGNCHIRDNHKKNRCPNAKCTSVYQCRSIDLHKSEKKKGMP